MAPRTVHYTQTSIADTRPKVPGWRHSGLRVVGRPSEDESPDWLLADAIRRTRQARVVRKDPRHPWHWLAQAQAAHKAGDHRKALAILLANEGDPSFHAAIDDKVMDVREAAYGLDGLCGRPYMLMRPFFYGSPILPRAWVTEEPVERFERMTRTRYERAVAAEKAAAGRSPVVLSW